MEPLSLADLKQHLVLDPDDTSEDARLSSMITAARRACELRINRKVLAAQAAVTLDAFPRQQAGNFWPFCLMPEETPLPDHAQIELTGGSVASYQIAYFDPSGAQIIMPDADTYADLSRLPAIVRHARAWPQTARRPDAVTITYQLTDLGAEDMEMVRQAMRLMIGHWYANREAVTDTRGVPAELPISITWLLEPLRAWAI